MLEEPNRKQDRPIYFGLLTQRTEKPKPEKDTRINKRRSQIVYIPYGESKEQSFRRHNSYQRPHSYIWPIMKVILL